MSALRKLFVWLSVVAVTTSLCGCGTEKVILTPQNIDKYVSVSITHEVDLAPVIGYDYYLYVVTATAHVEPRSKLYKDLRFEGTSSRKTPLVKVKDPTLSLWITVPLNDEGRGEASATIQTQGYTPPNIGFTQVFTDISYQITIAVGTVVVQK